MKYADQLEAIVRADARMMRLLACVRPHRLPDWLIAAGAVRSLVWDVLHGYTEPTPVVDVDVIYCNPAVLDFQPDVDCYEALMREEPSVKWNVFNQARAYQKRPGLPMIRSTVEGMMHCWVDTASCVGIRLNDDDMLLVEAPFGLEDLFELRVRPIQPPYGDTILYKKRLAEKHWKEQWPRLDIQEIP